MCGPRLGCSRMGSLGYERSLICFYTHLNQEVSNISVEDKQATSVVDEKKLLVSILLTGGN